MLSKDDPDSGVWTYAYDDAGRQTSQTDAKGQLTTFAYDSVGRLASKTWQSTPPQTTTYAYSQARSGYFNTAMLTEVASPVDVLKLDYDAAGQLARQQRIFESVTYSLERRYDAAGRLTGLTYPDADTVGTPSDPIRYDAAGRLQSIPGFVSNFDWDASGRMIFQVNLNGTVTTRTFSPERGHLTRILTTGPGGTLQDLQYTQDETGRITAVSSPFATESWSYGYDDLGRLVQADNVSDPLESQAFAYDAVGNMTYNSRVGTYVYPSPGQPRPHAPTTINGGSMTYDPNGNLLTGRGRNYTWDWENLPTQINTTQFVYGADRSRLKKLDSGNATLYPPGDDYEIAPSGVVTKYVNAVGVGVLGKRVGATPYWSHLDHLGSITLTTDGVGADNLRRTYRPYGDLLAQSGGTGDSRGFIDQREDPETGMLYLKARYHDSEAGVFSSPDSLHPLRPGVGANRFAYSGGDPVNRADRSGNQWIQICLKKTRDYNSYGNTNATVGHSESATCYQYWIEDQSTGWGQGSWYTPKDRGRGGRLPTPHPTPGPQPTPTPNPDPDPDPVDTGDELPEDSGEASDDEGFIDDNRDGVPDDIQMDAKVSYAVSDEFKFLAGLAGVGITNATGSRIAGFGWTAGLISFGSVMTGQWTSTQVGQPVSPTHDQEYCLLGDCITVSRPRARFRGRR